MKWIGIAGARSIIHDQVEPDIRQNVTSIFQKGNGVISGGAWGVDYIATDEALKHDPTGQRIKVIIPSDLKTYLSYFNKRASGNYITDEEVKKLFNQLDEVKRRNPESLIELTNEKVCRKTFHSRNRAVVRESDELHAYQVNESNGTKNAIKAAENLKKPVTRYNY